MYIYIYISVRQSSGQRTESGWTAADSGQTADGQRMDVKRRADGPRTADRGRPDGGRRTDGGRTADRRRMAGGRTADGGQTAEGQRTEGVRQAGDGGQRTDSGRMADGWRTAGRGMADSGRQMDGGRTGDGGRDCAHSFLLVVRRHLANIVHISVLHPRRTFELAEINLPSHMASLRSRHQVEPSDFD